MFPVLVRTFPPSQAKAQTEGEVKELKEQLWARDEEITAMRTKVTTSGHTTSGKMTA
jgi:hypothetical protein